MLFPSFYRIVFVFVNLLLRSQSSQGLLINLNIHNYKQSLKDDKNER
ncbi:hypothetical protein [Microcoleus sp.]